MSSDLCVFDDSFFSDLLQDNNDLIIDENPFQESNFSPNFFSNSPPSHQLENLSLAHLENVPNSETQFDDYSVLDVKTEDTQFPYDYQPFGPQSYSGAENVAKMMQRSYSSNCFEGKPSFFFQPRFDSLLESPNFQTQIMNSPDESFSNGQIRRVCSAGDLQKIQGSHRLSSSPLATTERSFMEEASFKVGRYSAEERKEKIHKYRAKRTQRNFSKTIKYACRKVLADNRPRVRGRFARNDETEEIPKPGTSNRYDDEDDSWIDGFHEEGEEETMGRSGAFWNMFDQSQSLNLSQIQYYGYS